MWEIHTGTWDMRGAERTMWRGREQPACSSVTHRLALSLLTELRMHGSGRWTALTGTFEKIRMIWDNIKTEPPHHFCCNTDASGGHPKEPPRLCGTDEIYRFGVRFQRASVWIWPFSTWTTSQLLSYIMVTLRTLISKERCFQASSCAAFLDIT